MAAELNVIEKLKEATGLSLMEAKGLVDAAAQQIEQSGKKPSFKNVFALALDMAEEWIEGVEES